MIDSSRRYVFVHIQKTGGSSVARALGGKPAPGEKHMTAREIRRRLDPADWDRFYKFSFVRNPWDRLVSWWSMIDAARAAPINDFYRFVVARARTFEEFLRNCGDEVVDVDGAKWIYRNQVDYLSDEDGTLAVDFVGRFENLQADFDVVAHRVLGRGVPLGKVNVSEHRHYSEYYTREMADEVGSRYARDIAAFGYTF